MLLTLLGIGAYTTYKLMDNESRKMRLDKLIEDTFDVNNDAHFDEFLSLLKSNRQKIIEYGKYDMRDFLYNAERELKAIPYLTENDIKLFKERCWRIKAEYYINERESRYESACKEMEEFEKKFGNKPTKRRVYQKSKTHLNPNELDKLKNTFFGTLVYCPDGGRFYSMTDRYFIFVVDQPEGSILDLIFYNSLFYVRYSTPTYMEEESVRKAGMSWKE